MTSAEAPIELVSYDAAWPARFEEESWRRGDVLERQQHEIAEGGH